MANKLKKIQNVIVFITLESANHTLEDVKKKKQKDWDYIDYLISACDEYKYNLYILSKDNVRYSFKNNVLNIDDMMTNTSFSLNETNTENTIIFQGQNNNNLPIVYVALMKLLYKLNFMLINPVNAIINASDKYLSSVIMSKYDIPQPNYVLIGKDDIEDQFGVVKNDLFKKLHSIYSSNPNIDDNHSNYKYVCKILNGSLGIGVFLCEEDEILSILQAIITLNPDIYILVQEFKQNTGDIRAHAFSFDGKNYEIIAAMKRNKIDGDFRSNVSLGADTNSIDLTPEQEQIILDTAKVSGCKWVGVDLMECKGFKDQTENVVIEYNSSPGVQGISEQINKNLFTIIFDKINDNLPKDANIEAPKELEENPEDQKKTNEGLESITETVQLNSNVKTESGNYAFEIAKTSNLNLYKFNPESISYNINKKSISIKDSSSELDIDYDKISPSNTIVFSRVMPDVADKLEDLYSKLIKDNFLFFNKKKGVEIAGDKEKTAKLLSNHKLPQPKYVLVDKNDVIN